MFRHKLNSMNSFAARTVLIITTRRSSPWNCSTDPTFTDEVEMISDADLLAFHARVEEAFGEEVPPEEEPTPEQITAVRWKLRSTSACTVSRSTAASEGYHRVAALTAIPARAAPAARRRSARRSAARACARARRAASC